MSHSRVARIPIEHLVAELAAFPIASESAFQKQLTALDPKLKAKTAALWRDAELELLRNTPALSIDEIVALRDDLWFGEPDEHWAEEQGDVPLAAYLRCLAARFLTQRGPSADPFQVGLGLAGDESHQFHFVKAQSRETWRWMTFALPPDLLLAALASIEGTKPPVEVETLPPQLQEMLARKQFAESHLHIGAGLDFPLLWISAQLGVLSGRTGMTAFSSPGAAMGEGRDFGAWLLRAAVARYCLAVFLREAPTNETACNFVRYFHQVLWPRMIEGVGIVEAMLIKSGLEELGVGRLDVARDVHDRIRQGSATLMQANRGVAYLEHWDRRSNDEPNSLLPYVHRADPIARLFPPVSDGQPSSEVLFVREALMYLRHRERANQRDVGFESLFWQTVRVRCLYYRHVVQRPLTPGLQWFIRTYARISPGRRVLTNRMQVESGALRSGAREGLRSLEIRTSPASSVNDALRFVSDAVSQVRNLKHVLSASDGAGRSPGNRAAGARCGENLGCDVELGIVLHISKDRGGGAKDGVPKAHWIDSNADPGWEKNGSGFRYAHFYNSRRESVEGLGRLLSSFPMTLAVVRGIDVCTDELGVPTWVLVPFFRYLHEVAEQTSATLRERFRFLVPPLRTTVHAGEDFTHLQGGFRRIDEAIRYLHLSEGDRLGHGVALGINARQWAHSAGLVGVPREERLLDLVWEWTCYARFSVPTNVDRKTYLEREIARLSQKIFHRPVAPYEMEQFVELLHCEPILGGLGFPNGRKQMPARLSAGRRDALVMPDGHEGFRSLLDTNFGRNPEDWGILPRFLTDRSLFVRGRKIEYVNPRFEAEVLEHLQCHLRRRIASLGITVEVNPSSNLLIGDLSDLREHPFWRLNPPRPIEGVEDPVAICVGSDDPLTFATRLPNEYALIFDSLVLAGVPHFEALQWIDQVRETSLRSRFTLPLTVATGDLTQRSFPTQLGYIEKPLT